MRRDHDRTGSGTVRVAGASVSLLLAAMALAGPASALRPRGTLVFYDVKVGIKGGESLTSDVGGAYTGDMVQESLSGSFTLDGRIRSAWFYSGRSPHRQEKSGGGYGPTVVQGSWSAKGSKWVDAPNKLTGPFNCGGGVTTHVPAQMELSWKRGTSSMGFTLAAAQQELYYTGFDGCPNDSDAGPVNNSAPIVYKTTFSLPLSAIGQKTITKAVSGPLAKNRLYFQQNCPQSAGSSCNLAWQGVARFTRTRVIKAY